MASGKIICVPASNPNPSFLLYLFFCECWNHKFTTFLSWLCNCAICPKMLQNIGGINLMNFGGTDETIDNKTNLINLTAYSGRCFCKITVSLSNVKLPISLRT
jgi:hypothetical protein